MFFGLILHKFTLIFIPFQNIIADYQMSFMKMMMFESRSISHDGRTISHYRAGEIYDASESVVRYFYAKGFAMALINNDKINP